MKIIPFLILNIGLTACTFSGANHDDDQEHKIMDKSMEENSAHWSAPAKETTRMNPITSNKDSKIRGSALYKKNCASCHGKQARGDGPAGKVLKPKPANLAKMAGQHTDGEFAWKITNGRGAMPPWKSILTENQIWDLVNYIQSLSSSQEKHKNDSHNESHQH